MTTEFVTNYIDKKLNENDNFIRYTFYELRVKNNLSEEEVDEFLRINRDYFENKGYKVYFTNEEIIGYHFYKIGETKYNLSSAIRDHFIPFAVSEGLLF